jgi:hypothetical protein
MAAGNNTKRKTVPARLHRALSLPDLGGLNMAINPVLHLR